MLAIQPIQKPTLNIRALIWSLGGHLLLLLLFILFQYKIAPNPPAITNEGLEVNLGNSDNGMGNDQPKKKEKPSEYQAAVVYKTHVAVSGIPITKITTNDPLAPVIDSANNTKTNDTGGKHTEPKVQQQQPRYAYGGETGKGGNDAKENTAGTNEGIGTKPGDMGVPGGTPGAKNYTGIPGNGSGGIGHNLTGRKIEPDKFEAEFSESGKVVIHVTVDRNGTIVNRRVVSTSNPQLTKIALEKLSTTKFSKSEGSEPQQFGDVTIVFKTRS